jgi:N-acetylmuramoyl-L-alanine amidase
MFINTEYKSKNHRDRKGEKIQFLILHYTDVPLWTTLGILTNDVALAENDRLCYTDPEFNFTELCANEFSTHYVNSEAGHIYQLVDEARSAYHAGVSFWSGQKNINDQSIGIENVNLGFKREELKFPMERGATVQGSPNLWCKFSTEQISALITLCKKIIIEHDIMPYDVLGHSDIACGRKLDPGPLFPWQVLAEAGIGLWYDVTESNINAANMPSNPVLWAQQKLAEYGYDCEQTEILDFKTRNVLQAFQMHFRQDNINGEIDLECLQILDSLCQRKYKLQPEEKTSYIVQILN